MDVKKIFVLLITVVILLIVGAFLINILVPNVVNQGVDAVESQLYRATGLVFDFNGNGTAGDDRGNFDDDQETSIDIHTQQGADNVHGFTDGNSGS